jgi:hypothetical protein
MPQTEYKVVQSANVAQLSGELAGLAKDRWKPILLSTTAGGPNNSVITTIVLEHRAGV